MTTKLEAVNALRFALKMMFGNGPVNHAEIDLFFAVDESNDIENIPDQLIDTGRLIICSKIFTLRSEQKVFAEICEKLRTDKDAITVSATDTEDGKKQKYASMENIKRKIAWMTDESKKLKTKEEEFVYLMETIEDYIMETSNDKILGDIELEDIPLTKEE